MTDVWFALSALGEDGLSAAPACSRPQDRIPGRLDGNIAGLELYLVAADQRYVMLGSHFGQACCT
eukprot:m.161461 g.161461  ORF g.161461 m.161461 type:complete len:65 (-) comp24853_c0_seq6:1500-1694(-)